MLAVFLASGSHLTAQRSATIRVDASRVVGPVNRLVFGQNMEAADNARIFKSDVTDMNGIQTGGGFWDPVKGAPVPAVVEQCRAVGMGMMRYPGGCLAHNFDWRKAVGPEAKRNGWLFGVDEYLNLCRAIGAEPIFTISDYALPPEEMPENSAGLVEYLNAPADATHPWAMKRKAWGHAEPYHVKWFELGNESVHGNHRVLPHRQFTPESYAAYANATAAAMRKVDRSIRIGIVMVPSAGTDVENDWNRTVVRLAGKSADFIVVHLYAPHANVRAADEEVLMHSTMAVGEQSERHLEEFRAMVQREFGRDLPLAVTEYNGSLGETLKPYRFSYGEALESADLVRIFLKPEHHVVTANYWQFLNGYFGMLRGPVRSATGMPQKEMPAFPLYRLWGQHFGTELVETAVNGPRAEFVGVGSVQPASGDKYLERILLEPVNLKHVFASNPMVSGDADHFVLHWKNQSTNAYPKLAHFSAVATGTPLVEYDLRFEARFVSDSPTEAKLGLGIGDDRGWEATHSGVGVDGVGQEWREYRGTYHAPADTKSLDLTARLEGAKTPVSGSLEVRGLTITAYSAAQSPAYALLTSSASVSADKKTLYLIVFNKSDRGAISAAVEINGFIAASARVWEVSAPKLAVFEGVGESKHGEAEVIRGGSWKHSFPARSMTAIEVTR
jgi:alpha-L-arabinofuranosidase